MKLGFGLMRLPLILGTDQIDEQQSHAMVDRFMAEGGTYFDTAYPYHNGTSEYFLRENVVKRYPRDSFTVTDKMPMFLVKKPEDLQKYFDEQLERCGVDYFDYYWLHSISGVNYPLVEQVDAFAFLRQKKAEGKARHIGFSYHDGPELLEKILKAHPETEYVQLQLNYLDWDGDVVRARENYEVCEKYGKTVIVMEPVKGGSLIKIPQEAIDLFHSGNDLSVASWAIRFAASQKNVMMVLSGMSNMEQMNDNLSYMKDFTPLSEQEMDIVKKAAEIVRSSIAIPCTGCRYCVAGCQKHIPIPDYFAIFNDNARSGWRRRSYYDNLAQTNGKASDCITCRQCEKICPQHIKITEYLKEMAADFDK